MLTEDQINAMSRAIRTALDPDRVILFGSYADGTADDDSDIDLLVVTETTLPASERYAAVRRVLADYPASFDIVVKTPEEFDRSRDIVNHIVYFADRYGRVLYDRRSA